MECYISDDSYPPDHKLAVPTIPLPLKTAKYTVQPSWPPCRRTEVS